MTAGRKNSHDLVVSLGVDGVLPGLYEVKRLSLSKGSKTVDRRFKVGQRGEKIYGRRDSEIKSFLLRLELFLDDCLWGVDAITDIHEFIDAGLERRHGRKFHERIVRLAKSSRSIPQLAESAQFIEKGGVTGKDIASGFAGINGIFLIVDDIYTLITKEEFQSLIGFDSASAEGPKLTYTGVIPLQKIVKETKEK